MVLDGGGNSKELPAFVLPVVASEGQKFIGMRPTGLAEET